ncbi:hypothetical protein HDU67_006698, partial [Dinochytrium kinnereticum]
MKPITLLHIVLGLLTAFVSASREASNVSRRAFDTPPPPLFVNYPNPSHRSSPVNGPGRRNACSGPSIRREWRELSPGERSDFLTAVRCLQQVPSILTAESGRSFSVYDDFA